MKTRIPLFILIALTSFTAIGSMAVTNITTCGATISTPGEYAITANLFHGNNKCITITSGNVTIDGQGYSITASSSFDTSGYGIYSGVVTNVRIKNIKFYNNYIGIEYPIGSTYAQTINCYFENGYYGIYQHELRYGECINNEIKKMYLGISNTGANGGNHRFINNKISECSYAGVAFHYNCLNNYFEGNYIFNCTRGVNGNTYGGTTFYNNTIFNCISWEVGYEYHWSGNVTNNTFYNNSFWSDLNSNPKINYPAGTTHYLYSGTVGNFWGRTSSPYFVAGTDVLPATLTDSYPKGSNPPPRVGDWIPKANTTITTAMTMEGNIKINANTIITLDNNSTLYLDLAKYKIDVVSGGGFLVKNGSTIKKL